MREYSGQEIAEREGVTRQAVAQTVKRALRKIFKKYSSEFPNLTPFEIAAKMMDDLNIEITTKNFNAFPLKLKKEIIESARVYAKQENYILPDFISSFKI